MHDGQLEDRLRTTLQAEGDALPLTITPEELERRLSIRRRERMGRRASLVAAGVGVVALGSVLAMSTGWLRPPDVGVGPSGAPTTSSIPTEAAGACDPLDLATMDRPPSLFMSAIQAGANAVEGQRSAYRLGDLQVGEEGTWDHDTIGIEPVRAGFPSERLQVVVENPGACVVGLRVDAKPTHNMGAAATSIADLTPAPTRAIEFEKLPPGDWFVQIHADFATVSGTSAWAEAFFSVEVADCTPLDPVATTSPPSIAAAVAFDDANRFGGVLVASEWNGRRLGTLGSWEASLAGLDPIVVYPASQPIELSSNACVIDASAETIRIDASGAPEADASPLAVPIIRGIGTKVVVIDSLPVGDWALRIRASFLTADGSPGWSETLFRVESMFSGPGLTVGPDYFEIWAEAGCTNYNLTSGASGEGTCESGYGVMEGREPLTGSSSAPLRFRLTDGWAIEEARVVAVDAELIEAGRFAPEYSVSFQENVGSVLIVPIELDPGSWIVRISLNGTREGDAFSANYDVAVSLAP